MICEPLDVKRAPQTSYAAQFSLPYTVARCLLNGEFGLADLESCALKDSASLELAGKLEYEIDPEAGFPAYRSGEIIVSLRNGKELRQRENIMPDDAIANADIERKFFRNAEMVMSRQRAQRILDAVLDIENAPDVGPIVALLGAV